MKNIIILLFLLLSFTAYSQNETIRETDKGYVKVDQNGNKQKSYEVNSNGNIEVTTYRRNGRANKSKEYRKNSDGSYRIINYTPRGNPAPRKPKSNVGILPKTTKAGIL